MKYSCLTESADERIVGDYPQGGKMVPPYDMDAPNSIYRMNYFKGRKVEFAPDLGIIEISHKAKVTDVLSIALLAGSGLFINTRMMDIIEKLNIVNEIAYFKVPVLHRGTTYQYFWMHLFSDLRSEIDFSRSTFFFPMNQNVENGCVKFSTYQDYLNFYSSTPKSSLLRAEDIFFSPTFINNFDLFYIGQFDKKIYISKKFHNMLVENGITGISYEKGYLNYG